MSTAATFLAALGTRLETALPEYAGKINYEYYGMSDMAMGLSELPWINVLWMTESVSPLSNQHNALAEVVPELQIDAYFPAENGYTLTVKEAALTMAANLRVALFGMFYDRVIDGWVTLRNVRTEMSRVNLNGNAYFVLSCTPQIALKLAVDQV